jgi:hypothetical protein
MKTFSAFVIEQLKNKSWKQRQCKQCKEKYKKYTKILSVKRITLESICSNYFPLKKMPYGGLALNHEKGK